MYVRMNMLCFPSNNLQVENLRVIYNALLCACITIVLRESMRLILLSTSRFSHREHVYRAACCVRCTFHVNGSFCTPTLPEKNTDKAPLN